MKTNSEERKGTGAYIGYYGNNRMIFRWWLRTPDLAFSSSNVIPPTSQLSKRQATPPGTCCLFLARKCSSPCLPVIPIYAPVPFRPAHRMGLVSRGKLSGRLRPSMTTSQVKVGCERLFLTFAVHIGGVSTWRVRVMRHQKQAGLKKIACLLIICNVT